MNPKLKLKVLIEIEAIKAEIEGMKQNIMGLPYVLEET